MNDTNFDPLEIRLLEAARQFEYPPTPDLSLRVSQELGRSIPGRRTRRVRPAAALLVIAVILLALLAVPPVRAALLDFLQMGAIRIQLTQPTATPTFTPSPGKTGPELNEPALTPSPTALTILNRLAGETSLQEAGEQAGFEIHIPTYPDDLGEPDRVYYQDIGGPAVLALWFEPGQSSQVRLGLLMLTNKALATKTNPRVITTAEVHGEPALWTEGEHILQLSNPDDMTFLSFIVRGHVLIWTEGEITYRLETGLDMAEAIKIAESLR